MDNMKQVNETATTTNNSNGMVLSDSKSAAFGRLIEACKRKKLNTIAKLLSQRPDLINQCDHLNRSLLHYAVITIATSASSSSMSSSWSGESDEDSNIDSNEDDDNENCTDCNDKSKPMRRPSAKSVDSIEQVNKRQSRRLKLLEQTKECIRLLSDKCDPSLWCQLDTDGLSILHLAVISSDENLVRYLIYEHNYSTKWSLVQVCDREHHSPLHWAVITNNLNCVKLLISHSGVSLAHQADINGATPIHYATQTSEYPKYRRQLRRMLIRGTEAVSDKSKAGVAKAPPDVGSRPGSCQNKQQTDTETQCSTVTTSSSTRAENHRRREENLEILAYLVRLPDINLECRDKDHRTPLLWAASSGNQAAIELLVTYGADLNCVDANRLGALHCAASHGYSDCLESLLAIASKRPTTGVGSNRANAAVVVDQSDNLECTPLFYAVLSGNIDCVEILLDKGAKIDWQDAKGRSAAHFAALKGQLNALKLLNARGGNLWLANKQGDLPLHYAIKSGRIQVVRWLLEHSPYERAVNAINNFGRAPIHLAVMRNNALMVEYLIKNGANLGQLVKVREKQSASKRSQATDSDQRIVLVNQSNAHKTGKSGGSVYRYETALDMARRLNHCDCLKMLAQNQAPSASQVLELRKQSLEEGNRKVAKRSLFDMQSADGTSPIGFETSASSVSSGPSPLQSQLVGNRKQSGGKTSSATAQKSELPKLSRPAPAVAETIPQSDESSAGGSSALSHSSITSVRLAGHSLPVDDCATGGSKQVDSCSRNQQTRRASKPHKGGISYHNNHINASIKCKLYGHDNSEEPNADPLVGRRHSSFPQMHPRRVDQQQQQRNSNERQQIERTRSGSCSAVSSGGQEIVTNVNVYTSPCSHCFDASRSQSRQMLQQSSSQRRQAQQADVDSDETDATSDATTVISQSDVRALGHHFDEHQLQQQHSGTLPVILSEQEQSASGASDETGPEEARRSRPIQHRHSPASDEPRFDRAQQHRVAGATGRSRKLAASDRYREQVRSPVAEYIRAPYCCQAHGGGAYRSVSQTRPTAALVRDEPPDVSQVRPKVDSHWPQDSNNNGHMSRSVSRNTHTRASRCRSSTGNEETNDIASNIERSIWKYKQESKLFDELKNLKRSQIRSGRANEALLVKRLVERFQNEEGSYDVLLGLDTYNGPFTYKSYELYLYDQLRKLSQSNSAKLAELSRLTEQQHQSEHAAGDHKEETLQADGKQQAAATEERDYLEEDMRAELELRRLIDTDSGAVMETPEAMEERQPTSVVTTAPEEPAPAVSEPSEELKTDEIERHIARMPSIQHSSSGGDASSVASSRRSSVEVEREKLQNLPLQVSSGAGYSSGDEKDELEPKVERKGSEQNKAILDEAGSLASSIIVDALGNISRASSAASVHQTELKSEKEVDTKDESKSDGEEGTTAADEKEEADDEPKETEVAAAPTSGRRRSVVNIGNKIEVIYHNVGIEIEPVADRARLSLEGSDTDEAEDAAAARTAGKRSAPTLQNVAEESSGSDMDPEASEQVKDPTEESSGKRQSEDFTASCENTSCTTDTTTTTTTTATTSSTVSTTACESEIRSGHEKTSERPERVDTIDETSQIFEPTQQVDSASSDRRSEFLSKLLPPRRRRASSPSALDSAPESLADQISRANNESRSRLSSRRATIVPPASTYTSHKENETDRLRASSGVSNELDDRSGDRLGRDDGDTGDSKQQRVFNGYDLDKLHRQRQLARQLSSEREPKKEEDEDNDESSKLVARRSPQSPRLRRKSERSRLPSMGLKIEVPVEEIHNRWLGVKETERRRLQHGRSQPNLSDMSNRQVEQRAMEAEDGQEEEDECSNYTLLYEINKKLKGLTATTRSVEKTKRQGTGSVDADETAATGAGKKRLGSSVLCRSRVVRIVDSRTLKRTSSLPESLIYSNDLLKRFNILKL